MDTNYLENNYLTLVGKVTGEKNFSHEIYGEKFYVFNLEIERLSGNADIIPITVSERIVTDEMLIQGKKLLVKGQFRSYNSYENEKNRLILTVFAKDVVEVEEPEEQEENEMVKNIMIICGGGNANHILYKIEKRICENELYKNYTFHIIAGFLDSDYDKLVEMAKNKKINIYRNVYNMAAILNKMDIVISAAGTVLFECCKMQIPTIFFCMADNQKDVIKGFGAKNVMIYAGDIRDDEWQTINSIFENVELLAHNYEMRKKMRKRMQNMIDGKGAERIARAIVTL